MPKDSSQGRRPLLGLLIMAAIAGVLVLTFFLDDVLHAFKRQYSIVAVVPHAVTLTKGSAVWIGGSEAGMVSQVGFLPSGRDSLSYLVVDIELPVSVREQVRRDSEVRVTASRLMGEQVINITPGSLRSPALEDGDTLRQRFRVTPDQLMQRAGAVRAQLDTVMVALRVIGPRVTERLDDTQRAFAGMQRAMAEARQLTGELQQGPAMRLLNDPRFRASLQSARTTAAELPATVTLMRERAGNAREVGAALARLQLRADSLNAQLQLLTSFTQNPNSSLARFQQDSALWKALSAARADLDSLIAETRRNPLRFVF